MTVVAVAGAILAYSSWKLNSIDRLDVKVADVARDKPQNFLIVGSDTRSLTDTNDADSGAIFGNSKEKPPDGQRADTIVVARVDPTAKSVELLSIPRDLWVRKPNSQSKGRINATYNGGAQTLIDTVQQDLGISINHYIEVNFDGFKGLVNAIDGVPMYFDRAMYDNNTGLRIRKAGCYKLDSVQALAFARSRHLFYSNGKKWISDPTGDEGRITRQQIFLRRAMAKVATLGITDANTVRKLIDVGVSAVKVDASFTVDDMIALARKFATFDSSTMVTHRLPTTAYTTDGGAQVLLLDDAQSGAVLDVFRGNAAGSSPKATTTTLPSGLLPSSLTVDVLNASGVSGVARKVSGQLGVLGFIAGTVTNAPVTAANTLRHAKGDTAAAQLVSSELSTPPTLIEDAALAKGHLTLVIGKGSIKVTGTVAPTTTAAPTSTVPGATTTTIPTSDKSVGFVTGDPPAGVKCGV